MTFNSTNLEISSSGHDSSHSIYFPLFFATLAILGAAVSICCSCYFKYFRPKMNMMDAANKELSSELKQMTQDPEKALTEVNRLSCKECCGNTCDQAVQVGCDEEAGLKGEMKSVNLYESFGSGFFRKRRSYITKNINLRGHKLREQLELKH